MDQELLFFSLLGAGLLVVLFVHELGHLLAARHYGVKVLSLSVGFGPQLISFTDNLGTSWKLRAIPIGGSCVIDDNSKLKNSPAEKRANSKFRLRNLQQRAVILAAGPIFNLAFAASIALLATIMCRTCGLYYREVGSLGAAIARLMAEFSVAIALFNLLPFMPLDGGRLCLTAFEAGIGRPMSSTGEKRFFLISMVSLTGLTLAYFIWAFSALSRTS
jgi:membrane-associated protease RseP (regulator of RpoE activity)